MIETNPPLDEVEEHFAHLQEKIGEMRKMIEDDFKDTTLEPTMRFVFASLSFMYMILYDHAGYNVGTVRIIKKISEMLDKNATKDQLQEQIQLIEKKVIDTLVPMDEIIKKAKEAQSKSVDYIG